MKEEKSKDEPQLYDDDDEVEEDDEKKAPIEPSKGQTTSLNSAALTPPPTFHRREYNRVRKTDKSLSSSSTPSSSFASNDQIANIPEKVAAANQLTGPSHNVSLASSSSPDQPAFHRREYNRARARKEKQAGRHGSSVGSTPPPSEQYQTPTPGAVSVIGTEDNAPSRVGSIVVGDDREKSSDKFVVSAPLLAATLVEDPPTVAAVAAVPVNGDEEDQRQSAGVCSAFRDRRLLFLFGGLVLIVAVVAVVLTLVFTKDSTDPITTDEPTASPEPETATVYAEILRSADEKLDTSLWELSFTPQFKAMEWLSSSSLWPEDTLYQVPVQQIVDRYVLALLYYSLDGPNWANQYGFLTDDEHVCSWNENEEEEVLGVDCRDFTLISLHLSDNMLVGGLPTEIGLLSTLNFLDLSGNSIDETIPSELFSASSPLEELLLSGNELTGNIPSEFGLATNLLVVDLGGNELSGELEDVPFDNDASYMLRELWLNNNEFEGSLPPELSALSDLEYLNLSENSFTGTLPSELASLESLKRLIMFNIELEGSVPLEFGLLEDFEVAELQGSGLTEVEEALCGSDGSRSVKYTLIASCAGDPPAVACSCCTHCCDEFNCYQVGI